MDIIESRRIVNESLAAWVGDAYDIFYTYASVAIAEGRFADAEIAYEEAEAAGIDAAMEWKDKVGSTAVGAYCQLKLPGLEDLKSGNETNSYDEIFVTKQDILRFTKLTNYAGAEKPNRTIAVNLWNRLIQARNLQHEAYGKKSVELLIQWRDEGDKAIRFVEVAELMREHELYKISHPKARDAPFLGPNWGPKNVLACEKYIDWLIGQLAEDAVEFSANT